MTILQALLPCLSRPAVARGQRQERTVKANVLFLATSASVRRSMGESRGLNLEVIGLSKGSYESSIGRLINEYPPYRASLSRIILRSEIVTTFRVRRDYECTRAYMAMHIPTTPGDPIAISFVPLSLRPALPSAVQPDEILPC